jgi:hypothetical protein
VGSVRSSGANCRAICAPLLYYKPQTSSCICYASPSQLETCNGLHLSKVSPRLFLTHHQSNTNGNTSIWLSNSVYRHMLNAMSLLQASTGNIPTTHDKILPEMMLPQPWPGWHFALPLLVAQTALCRRLPRVSHLNDEPAGKIVDHSAMATFHSPTST